MSKAPQLSQSYSSPRVFADTAAIAASRPEVGRVLELVAGERYKVSATDLGSGISTANGLFANQIAVTQTYAALTWFVDPLLGTDSPGFGTATGTQAFRTIQFAWDSLPSIINDQQTIQLADGLYNSSSVPGASQPRPAVLWGRGKVTTFRSALSGDDIDAPIVIKGNTLDNTAVQIETGSEYTYGVYNNKGNLGIQYLTIKSDGVNQAEALLVSHRTDSHVYAKDCIIDGIGVGFAKIGASCESTGQIEFIDGKIKNCATGATTQTSGDNFTLATRLTSIIEACTIGAVVKNNSYMSFNSLQDGKGKVEIITTCTTGLIILDGGQVTMTGQDSTADMIQIANPINVEGGYLRCTFSELLSDVVVENGMLQLRQSNYQGQLTLNTSDLWLKNSNSFVSPSTANTSALPILIDDYKRIFDDGANVVTGLGGGSYLIGLDTLTYTGSTQTRSISDLSDTYEIISSGGTKTACQIDSTGISEGRSINLTSKTLGVTFTNGTHMELPADFTIGAAAAQLTGVTLTMSSGQWKVVGIGQTR